VYKDFEADFKKIDPEYNFFRFYLLISVIVGTFFVFLMYFFPKWNRLILTIIMSFILIILCLIYEVKNYKKLIPESSKQNIFKKIFRYILVEEEDKLDNIIAILKRNKIRKKNDILLMINYYNNRLPINIATSFSSKFISFIVTIASYIVIFVDEEQGVIDYNKFFIFINSAGSLFFIIIFIYLSISFAKYILKFHSNDLYLDIDDYLSYIYVNYDHFKRILNKKN